MNIDRKARVTIDAFTCFVKHFYTETKEITIKKVSYVVNIFKAMDMSPVDSLA